MKIAGIVNIKKQKNKIKRLIKNKRFSPKKITLYTAGVVFGIVVLMFVWNLKDIPTPTKLAKLHTTESTKILDRNGGVLYQTGEERRTVIDKKDIPDIIKNATIAAEDANFYNHSGVDFKGIARAAVSDILHLSLAQGGSTITQQFVKNALLSNEKTFSRKIKELIISIEIEQIYSKEDILAMYLNEIPYGGNIYGIEQASQSFFGKSAKELTLSEAAAVAGIPRAPTYYSPYGTHTDKLLIRKNYILDRMEEFGYASREEVDKAKTEAPCDGNLAFKQKRENITSPHFVMYVKEKLVEMYGERLVDSGGLKVTTSLDSEKQKAAEQAIINNTKKLDRYNASNAALVSLDTQSGEILAMVGSKDYFDIENDGNVNVTDSLRQPGSSFKPIVYATAFKNRFFPGFTLFDLSTDFNGYKPQNYDGTTHGAVTIRTALANSLNIPAVKMLGLVGIPEALKTANDLGITTLTDTSRYGLSLVLGGGEVKPIEMAGAFATFGNNGTFHKPEPILKVEDNKGKVLYEYKKDENSYNAIAPEIAYEISDILDDDNARCMVFGCQNYLNFGDKHVAAKTGTTQEFHDAWTVGYSPKITAAVWVGNNDNTKMSSGADGSVLAAPIFHDYMIKFLDNSEFKRPDTIKDATVEKYSNKLPSSYSQITVKDIFAPWQIPTDRDDVNVLLRVNKINNKIATDKTPAELIEEKMFFNLHNEWGKQWKNYQNWEAPIRAWAQAQGMSLPDYEKDNSYSNLPSITITEPLEGTSIKTKTRISVATSSEYEVASVTYLVDDQIVSSSTSSPFNGELDPSKVSNGPHKLTAKLSDRNGVSTQTSININTTNGDSVSISNLLVSEITSSGATISYATDKTTDSSIFIGLSANNYDLQKYGGLQTKSHSLTLSSLKSNTKYYYKITATTLDGLEGTTQGSFATL
jgi:1A family penicillin-binding protein